MGLWQIILLVVGLVLVLLGPGLGRSIILRVRSSKRKVNEPGELIDLRFGSKPPWLKISPIDIIYGVCMLAGILAKELWDSFNELGYLKVRPSRAIAALIVSPIIYAGVYSSFLQDQVNLLGMAIAFQNGFFWQAVFRTAQGKAET